MRRLQTSALAFLALGITFPESSFADYPGPIQWNRYGECYQQISRYDSRRPSDAECEAAAPTHVEINRRNECVRMSPNGYTIKVVEMAQCQRGSKYWPYGVPAMTSGEPYAWTAEAKSRPAVPPEPAFDLVGIMRGVGTQVSNIYKQAITDATTIRPAAAQGSEDQEKIDLLIQALKQGVANLNPTNSAVIPATHWRARETARMIVVMSQIVAGVFEDFSGVSQTSDPDPAQRARITAFQQALGRIRASIEFLKSAYGLKGFAGEPSRASGPLVLVAKQQLLQLARALSFDVNSLNGRPRYQAAIENMQATLSQIASLAKERGDTDRTIKPLVEELAKTWNDKNLAGTQELIQRALKAGGEFATEAQLLYLTLSSLGNIHGKVGFQMPGTTPVASNTVTP